MITKPGHSFLSTLADTGLWRAFAAIGVSAVHTGPLKRAGGLFGRESTPSVDGHFDRISTDIDEVFGTEAEFQGMCAVQRETWTYSDQAGAWYHHRFHDFQPDLNVLNPEVRAELSKVVAFWERLGVSGFRVDAVPFVIERTAPGVDPRDRDYGFLTELREQTSWRRGDAVFLAEANVPSDELRLFFGDADGAANRLQMLFAFRLNEALMLALARQDPGPLADALHTLPPLPRHGQWATFLRNHDEVDLSGLTTAERDEVFAAFGPDRRQQLYRRGIRRRLAPMLADERRLRMAYSLQFTMPGTPVLRYGDEIGIGGHTIVPVDAAGVLAHGTEAPGGAMVFVHNLADRPVRVGLPPHPSEDHGPVEVLSNREYPECDLRDLELDGYGYRWIRLRRSHGPGRH
ncbi:alpha-amylase family glycosyl hydrolase [Dactylosporangium sp. NPDC049140]|uniref:alpha-amylase family glycosyl hydrolase n=1 Tax=Dactylosporangium sp. NPDC049140 TaxID=3155647 RepID=UPI0033F9061F